MATDFGTGIAGISGWPLRFVFISGFQLLGQDLCHRLQCIRGSLASDPNAGWDLRQLLRGTCSAVAAKAASIEKKRVETGESATGSMPMSQRMRPILFFLNRSIVARASEPERKICLRISRCRG